MMEGSEVIHEDGRKCIYRGGEWLWDGVNGNTYKPCEYDDHPIPYEEGDIERLAEAGIKDSNVDRGEFGMPGLGGGVPTALPGDDAGVSIEWNIGPGRVHEVTLRPTLVVNHDSITVDYGEKGYTVPATTPEARYTLAILPDILTQFLEKNQKYAMVQDGYELGDQGIIPDLNRKLGILVDRIWHGNPTVGEETDEVIGDMIGHLFLLLAKRNAGG